LDFDDGALLMNITHCPECSTAFKVSPEQLSLASGWVRCGRCGAVFEAQQHFSPPMASDPTPAPPLANSAPVQDEAAHAHGAVMRLEASKPAAQAAASAHGVPTPVARTQSLWLIGCGVLVLLFVWQAIVSQRHLLAAEEPGLKPWLEVLCAPVACEVAWPQEPHSIQIENTSFNEDPEGGYALQIRLRNTQHHPVATPYLELSLIDLQDQVVVRRVFSVREMGFPESLAALRDARATLRFDLDAQVSEHVSGFHALIFYP
jgi:predicted Zn finger-like uncharacterized protein